MAASVRSHSGYIPEPSDRFVESPYDGEIAYADGIRPVMPIEAAALYDRMLIIFASDHGESLANMAKRAGFFVYHSTCKYPVSASLASGIRAHHVAIRTDHGIAPHHSLLSSWRSDSAAVETEIVGACGADSHEF